MYKSRSILTICPSLSVMLTANMAANIRTGLRQVRGETQYSAHQRSFPFPLLVSPLSSSVRREGETETHRLNRIQIFTR